MKRAPLALAAALLLGLVAVLGYALFADPAPKAPPSVQLVRPAPPEPEPPPGAAAEPDPAADDDVEWPADAPRTVYGAVTDPAGQPIIGATVRVRFHARRPDRTGDTDASGAFRLERVEPDIARFEVGARGYEPQVFEDPALPAAPRVRWDVVLEPAHGIFGVVLAERRPAPGAWVALRPSGERRWLGSTHADGSGRFALDWPEGDGPFTLWVFHGQHGQAEVEVTEPGELTVELPGGGYIEGNVVDRDGRPVPRFSVTATPLVRPAGGPPAQSFESGTGAFSLGPLAPGNTRVWAAAEGYQPGEITGVEVKTGEVVRGLRIVLDRSATLSGRVTDAGTGQPVEGAQIIPAEWRSGALAETVGAFTDEDGRYTLRALPGVRTSIQVSAPGYRPVLIGGVEGGPGEQIVRDFALTSQQRDTIPTTELTGIGAVLGPARGGIMIRQIVEGGPAADGLREGDVVVMVDGKDARKLGLSNVAQAIRGEVGTEVELWVRRAGRSEPERVVLTRRRVAMPDRNHQGVR
ncbi:MAG: carboxypeptidase regulatory-like domain-containing protein [Myxococcales bacterium]|nr:carboxypeptidase regulatory-like domain-containing protein [Myxococcales bacterium]